MPSDWNIRFPREMVAKATERKKHLYAVGYHGGGRAEACMYLEPEDVTFLWRVSHNINRGMTRQEAFEDAQTAIGESKAKQAAKAAS